MSKVISTITIDPRLKELAKKKNINISAVTERYLKKELEPTKSDLPDEVLKVICKDCKKEIEEGYICKESLKVWCLDCHNNLNVKRECYYLHEEDISKNKYHEHSRWVGSLSERPVDLDKKNGNIKEFKNDYNEWGTEGEIH